MSPTSQSLGRELGEWLKGKLIISGQWLTLSALYNDSASIKAPEDSWKNFQGADQQRFWEVGRVWRFCILSSLLYSPPPSWYDAVYQEPLVFVFVLWCWGRNPDLYHARQSLYHWVPSVPFLIPVTVISLFICMHACLHVCLNSQWGQLGVGPLLLCESSGLNSACLSWQEMPYPTELPQWLLHFNFYVFICFT